MSSLRWAAGIALLAVLSLASPARAADSTATAPRLTTGSIPGRAGLGGLVGGSWYFAAGDFADGAQPRFDFAGSFRLQMTPTWRLQVSPGFTWSGYTKHADPPFVDPEFPADRTKQHYLVQLVPISAQLQYTMHGRTWNQHIGVGPGVYRVLVQHNRKDLQDPVTFRVHRGMYLGATLEYGAERYFKSMPNTSFEWNIANHWVNAVRDDQFPAGWNDRVGTVAIRAGVNYYFDVARLKAKEQVPLPASSGRKAGS